MWVWLIRLRVGIPRARVTFMSGKFDSCGCEHLQQLHNYTWTVSVGRQEITSALWPMANFCGGFAPYSRGREDRRRGGSKRGWSSQGYVEQYGIGNASAYGGDEVGKTTARTMIKDLAPYQPNTVSLPQLFSCNDVDIGPAGIYPNPLPYFLPDQYPLRSRTF